MCVFRVLSFPCAHVPCCNLHSFQCRDPLCFFLSPFLFLYPFPCPFLCPCPYFSSTSSTHTRHRRAPHTDPQCTGQQPPTTVLQMDRKQIHTQFTCRIGFVIYIVFLIITCLFFLTLVKDKMSSLMQSDQPPTDNDRIYTDSVGI